MNSKPVFVLLTATTCPGCVNFKAKVWPSLKEELIKDNKVQVVHIEVPTTGSKPDPTKYHPELSRFIGWFPTMFLFPADRWNNHSSQLIGIVKNGKIVPPGVNDQGTQIPEHVEPMVQINVSKEDTIKWIDFTINNPDGMFQRGSHFGKTNNVHKEEVIKTADVVPKNKTGETAMEKLPNGNYKIPTAGYYARFERSRVE